MERINAAVDIMENRFVDISKVTLIEEDTPEKILMIKETFKALSDEANEFMRVVLDAPERLFLVNGKLKERSFVKYCKRKYGWSSTKVKDLRFELGFYCQMALLRRR